MSETGTLSQEKQKNARAAGGALRLARRRLSGWRGWLRRAGVAWAANLYLRVAGITGRY